MQCAFSENPTSLLILECVNQVMDQVSCFFHTRGFSVAMGRKLFFADFLMTSSSLGSLTPLLVSWRGVFLSPLQYLCDSHGQHKELWVGIHLHPSVSSLGLLPLVLVLLCH